MFAIAFWFSAVAVAINMPALQSVFLLPHGMLPHYLSGMKSRCVASSARWEDKIGLLFVEHHDDHSREGGTKKCKEAHGSYSSFSTTVMASIPPGLQLQSYGII